MKIIFNVVPVWGWILIILFLFMLIVWSLFAWFYKATQKFCDISSLGEIKWAWEQSKIFYSWAENQNAGALKKLWRFIMWDVCANLSPKSYPEIMKVIGGNNTNADEHIRKDKNWVWIKNYGWFIPNNHGVKLSGIGRWWQKYIHKIMLEIYLDAKEKGTYRNENIIILNPNFK